jgi:hypothetical protein
MRSKMIQVAIGMSTGLILSNLVLAAPPADWSSVPATAITLFYPGQSSLQWLLSKEHKRAYKKVAQGDSCISCHEGEEREIGDKLVAGGRLEPAPIKGKQGTVDLALQVAYDDDNAYFRFQWKTLNQYPGIAHPFERFDGKQWKHYGYPKLDKVVQDGGQPGIYEDRLSMLVDDGSVPNFAEQGCWVSCHNGMRDMQGLATKAEVQANPLLGKAGLNKKDVRKYLPSTRTGDSWDSTKSASEVAEIKARGGFLDLMQWRGHRSNPVGMADDFYVLAYRNNDAGKGPFRSNVDKKKHQPKFMYDAKKVGSNAIHESQIRTGPVALVRERNAVPFDSSIAWKEGDLIPSYIISREDATGSAADNDDARGEWTDGVWTVVWTRHLNLTNPDDKRLEVGKAYTFGFAVHDDNITTRGHHVSWPMTVGFGAKADIEATRLR